MKLSTMMVYKLAQTGKIPSSKIGSNWRFSQEKIDDWLLGQSTGKGSTPEPVKNIVADFVSTLKRKYKENLVTVIIFGSYARGEADAGSDIDVLIVLKNIEDYWLEKFKIEKLAYAETFEKERCVVIAPVLMNEKEFLTGTSPFIINVRKEGNVAA